MVPTLKRWFLSIAIGVLVLCVHVSSHAASSGCTESKEARQARVPRQLRGHLAQVQPAVGMQVGLDQLQPGREAMVFERH